MIEQLRRHQAQEKIDNRIREIIGTIKPEQPSRESLEKKTVQEAAVAMMAHIEADIMDDLLEASGKPKMTPDDRSNFIEKRLEKISAFQSAHEQSTMEKT